MMPSAALEPGRSGLKFPPSHTSRPDEPGPDKLLRLIHITALLKDRTGQRRHAWKDTIKLGTGFPFVIAQENAPVNLAFSVTFAFRQAECRLSITSLQLRARSCYEIHTPESHDSSGDLNCQEHDERLPVLATVAFPRACKKKNSAGCGGFWFGLDYNSPNPPASLPQLLSFPFRALLRLPSACFEESGQGVSFH